MAATTKTLPRATHDIRLCGLTGLIFAIITTSLILFLEGFVTTSWAVKGKEHQGLWQTCETKDSTTTDEWFKIVKVFSCLSLVGIVFTFLLITFYLKSGDCKNFNLLILTVFSFLTAIFMLVTIALFGANGLQGEDTKSSWSYWVVVVAAILAFLAAILSVVQVRKSNVLMCVGTSQE